jgi:hypothetical protein
MTTDERRRLQVIHLDKERAELRERLRATGKRTDHFERALRREEISLLDLITRVNLLMSCVCTKRLANRNWRPLLQDIRKAYGSKIG